MAKNEKNGKSRRRTHKIPGLLERIDSFGQPLAAFNIGGQSTVNTTTGGILTLALATIVLTYSSIKLLQLIDKHNPNVSEVLELDFYD